MNETLNKYFYSKVGKELHWAGDCCDFLLEYNHWDGVYDEKGVQIALLSSEINQKLDLQAWKKIKEEELENLYQKYWKEGWSRQEQFFAVLFARIHNLSEKQIRQIGDRRRERYALDMLNFFYATDKSKKSIILKFTNSELTLVLLTCNTM